MKENLKDVGKRIFDIRTKLNLTQEEFGEMIDGAKKGIVSRWENGMNLPNRKRLEMIAEKGGISVEKLLFGSLENYARDRIETITHSKDWENHFQITDENRYEIVDIALNQVLKIPAVKDYFEVGNMNVVNMLIYNEVQNAGNRRMKNTQLTNTGLCNFTTLELSNIMDGIRVYSENGVDENLYNEIADILEYASYKIFKLKEKYDDTLK